MSQPTEKPYTKYHAARLRRPRVDAPAALGTPAPNGNGHEASGAGSARAAAAPVAIYRADDQPAGDRAEPDLRLVPAGEPRRRRFHWWYLAAIPLALLVAFGVWAFVGYRTFDKAVRQANYRITKPTRAALVDPHGGVLSAPSTILVIGSDRRGRQPARSDTIMLMRFDPSTHSMSQLSIPRDTLVEIPGHGQGKINEAYFWGGAPLAIKVISGYTGVPVNHIMVVNFHGFPDLINSVGGVVVNVPKDITSWYTGGRTVRFKKGPQLMNGRTALIYSRIRYVDNDFFRMGRQQQVVQALEKKTAQPRNFFRLPWIGKEFMKGVSTDLSTGQIVELAYLQWRTTPARQFKWVLPGTPEMIGGGSYVVVDPAVRDRMVKRFLSK